jgi:hypothetical protein
LQISLVIRPSTDSRPERRDINMKLVITKTGKNSAGATLR